MSSVINRKIEGCKPWQAPKLNDAEDDKFDFKISGNESVQQRIQQQSVRQQAFEQSYAKGYLEGMAQGQIELTGQLAHFQSLMASLAMPIPGIDDAVVDEMVQLCMIIVKQMVRRELKISSGDVVSVIRESLSLLPIASASVTIELNPEDALMVGKSMIHPDVDSNWKIVEDPLMMRGGCRVMTNASRIDATIESRINAAITSILGDEQEAD